MDKSDEQRSHEELLKEVRELRKEVGELRNRDTRTREEKLQDERAFAEWQNNEGH